MSHLQAAGHLLRLSRSVKFHLQAAATYHGRAAAFRSGSAGSDYDMASKKAFEFPAVGMTFSKPGGGRDSCRHSVIEVG